MSEIPEFFANGFIAHNCRNDDLYGAGHPPDGLVALAMAHHASMTQKPVRLLGGETPAQRTEREVRTALDRATAFLGGNGGARGGNGAGA